MQMGALGADTVAVNDQLLAFPSSAAYNPQGYAPQTVGVPQVTPSFPPYIGGAAPTSAAPGASSVGGYGTSENNSQAAAIANANPFNLRVSPVVWAVFGLVLSLVLLKAIHWRETLQEAGAVGPFHEEADERA